MKKFTTQHCAFCWVANCVVTGCDPDRKPGHTAHCSKCNSQLPPRGEILSLRYLKVENPTEDDKVVAQGYMMRVKGEHTGKEDWFLAHCRGGRGSILFKHIGKSGEQLKKWLEGEFLVAKWPPDSMLSHEPLVPFK